MHHTLDRIANKPTDYKLCLHCGEFNWYENEHCVSCRNEITSDETLNEKSERIISLREEIDTQYTDDEMEVEV